MAKGVRFMIKYAHQMKCGNCGCPDFKIFTNDKEQNIMVECQGCKDISHIVPTCKLEIEWGEKSDGRLTIMD